ncbi:amine sulfotransferase-like isoform X3 [Esox lucius]|uniref:amine sulfotransferase-like isoform X3 n=1 Tax=Esox lucius TaxID=8010 RepID=UPI001476E567|nr:amine sulfotransferase-like isoform X3 [Esox lucius]
MCEERLYSTNTVKQGCQNSFLGGRNISGYRFNQQLIQTWDTRMEEQRNPNSELFQHKGFNLIRGVHDSEHIDSLKTFEVREDDILVVTYPKSGTTWMQYIISLMFHESEMTQGDEVTMKHVPWLEVKYPKIDFGRMSSPRTFVSHLPTLMVPDGFKRKGKVMYISRNPKDVAVSFYHFHNVFKHLENKGKVGDWKTMFTVDQSEMFDKACQEKMKDFPMKFDSDL